MTISVKYTDVYNALSILSGVKLLGTISGPPTTRIPLREIYYKFIKPGEVGSEEYGGVEVRAAEVSPDTTIVCHFSSEEPDDFCVVLKGGNLWQKLTDAANKLSKLTRESYTRMLAALVHSLQGLIHREEGELEEVRSPDDIIEELLTWLPEYVTLTD
jgi:hypothetical protein